MNFFSQLFGGGIKEAAEGVTTLAQGIRSAVTGKLPPAEEAAVNTKLLELENAAMGLQTQINLADAQSNDAFQRRWRPAVGWVGVFGLAVQYIVYPIAAIAGVEIPKYDFSELLTLLFAILGLGSLRSLERKKNW